METPRRPTSPLRPLSWLRAGMRTGLRNGLRAGLGIGVRAFPRTLLHTFLHIALPVALMTCSLAGRATATWIDDRTRTEPVASWWTMGLTAAQTDSVIAVHNARLVGIDVVHTNPTLLNAMYVENTGSYQRNWWWVVDTTMLGMLASASSPHARLIDVERYTDSVTGAVLFAGVILEDDDSSSSDWWFTPEVIDPAAAALQRGARPVDIEGFNTPSGRRYDVLMVNNRGADSTGWWPLMDVARADLDVAILEHSARVLDLEPREGGTGRYDAILVANQGSGAVRSWFTVPVKPNQIDGFLSQNGARLVDLKIYFQGVASTTYAALAVNNSNELTVQVADVLRYGTDGATGCYLKQVDGPVLASLQPVYVFEPASLMKTVAHLHTMRRVMSGLDNLDSMVTYSVNYSGSCPIGGVPFVTHTLRQTLSDMMLNSDNAATQAVLARYGVNAVNATARNVAGMTNTQINHTPIGCYPQLQTAPNWMTLEDITRMFERIVDTSVVDVPTREAYLGLMLNEDNFIYGFSEDLQNVLLEEATQLGMPALAPAYWHAMRCAWKPGSYWIGASWFESVGGWVQLPIWNGTGSYAYEDYVFGTFVSRATDPGGRDFLAAAELFRGLIRERLRGFPTAAPIAIPLPTVVALQPNYPNPFNPQTSLPFTLATAGHASLGIYDLRGRQVVGLFDGVAAAGTNSVTWDGRDQAGREVAAGTYLVRLLAGDQADVRKISLVR